MFNVAKVLIPLLVSSAIGGALCYGAKKQQEKSLEETSATLEYYTPGYDPYKIFVGETLKMLDNQ